MNKILLTFSIFLGITYGCKTPNPVQYQQLSGFAQGTTWHITYENIHHQDYTSQIDSILKAFDLTFSEYNPNSIISRINRNDSTVVLDTMFITVFNKSKEVYEASNHTMDITVGPLVNAWGFGPNRKSSIDKHLIDSLLQFVGLDKVSISGNKLIKENKGIVLDMNAIAQGYSVEVVSLFLEKKGIKNYMVEIGGEVRVKGRNAKGNLWHIGVDKPVEGNDEPGQDVQAIIELDNRCMTTAGNYRKFFEENGVKYAHTINPQTGYPAKTDLLSVTIIANDCITADAYDTGCMVLGLEGTRQLLKKHPEIDAYLIYSDKKGNYKIEYTKGVKLIK